MRWMMLTVLGLVFSSAARAQDIVDVLRHSQQQRLESFQPAPDGPRSQAVRRSFEQLRAGLPKDVAVDLFVIAGPVVAETLHGHIVVANQALADLPEGERLFVLAHELGHVVNHHWMQMGLLFKRWVPGAVTQDQTDPVSEQLGREASGLAHQQEFEADHYALQTLRAMGRSPDDAFAAFTHLGMTYDTATHPGTRKRVASLRAVQAGEN